MARTKKTAGQTAQKAQKAAQSAAVVEAQQPTFISPEELVSFPDDKKAEEKAKEKEAKKAEKEANKKAKEATRVAKQQAQAREDRACKVAGRIKAEASTLSALLRSVWVYATELDEAGEVQKADSLAIMADFKAVTGQDWPATRREFAQAWIEAIHKYTKATENGKAVSTKSRAGYIWAVPFKPSHRTIWGDIVGGWAKQRNPLALEYGHYYTKDKKGLLIKAKATEARKAIEEAEAIAKAVAEAKAEAGEKTRQALKGKA